MYVAGSFDRCEICANAEHLLKTMNYRSEEEREIVKIYRRRHIAQQFEERLTLKKNIESTHELDANGRPKRALLFNDAMTCTKGNLCESGAHAWCMMSFNWNVSIYVCFEQVTRHGKVVVSRKQITIILQAES